MKMENENEGRQEESQKDIGRGLARSHHCQGFKENMESTFRIAYMDWVIQPKAVEIKAWLYIYYNPSSSDHKHCLYMKLPKYQKKHIFFSLFWRTKQENEIFHCIRITASYETNKLSCNMQILTFVSVHLINHQKIVQMRNLISD